MHGHKRSRPFTTGHKAECDRDRGTCEPQLRVVKCVEGCVFNGSGSETVITPVEGHPNIRKATLPLLSSDEPSSSRHSSHRE